MGSEGVKGEESRLLVLSQLGGATKYKSEDNLIGLAHYLQSLKNEEKPEFFVVLGGVLPDMPRKGSMGNFNRLLVIEEGVANLEDAAAVMKPHLERILRQLPQSAKIIYAFGKEDIENIKHLEEMLIYDYNYNPEGIANRMKVVGEMISSRKEIIKSTTESRKVLKSQLKNASKEEREKLLEELENIEVKLSINSEEVAELEVRGLLLEMLYDLALQKVDVEDVEDAIRQAKKRLKEIKGEMKELKGDGNVREYNELKKEAKWISVKIRALNQRLNESVDSSSIEKMSKRKAQALIFTRQIPLSKSAADLIHEIAYEHYKSMLNDAFGRKRSIIIQGERVSSYKVNNYNVILESPIEVYTQKSTVDEGSMLYKYMENNALKELANSKVNILIKGHNLYSYYKILPLLNHSDSMLAVLNQGPFADLEKRAKLYNLHVKTNETKAIERGLMSSGATMISIGSGTPRFTFLDSNFLAEERRKSDIEEEPKLKELLEKINSKSAQEENGSNGAFKPELERAILSNKLPSEIKDRELKYLDKGLLLSLRKDNIEIGEHAKLKIASIQDIHIGNYANYPLFKAALRDIAEKKPDILLVLGDIYEGNLNNYKNMPRDSNKIDDSEKFSKFLEGMNLSKEERNEILLQYFRDKEKQVIYNIDQQPGEFILPMAPIIIDIIKRSGYILIASGNHPNKTVPGGQFDEATSLQERIYTLLAPLAERGELPSDWRSRIKTAPGNEEGGDIFYINHNGKDYIIDINHILPKPARLQTVLTKERNNSTLLFGANWHEPEGIMLNGKIVVDGAALQRSADNPFLKEIRASITETEMLNGYTYVEVELSNGKVAMANIENRLAPELKPKMEELEAKKEELYYLYRHSDKTMKIKN